MLDKLRNLVSSLEYLVSNGRQVLLGRIRLGSSATLMSNIVLLSMLVVVEVLEWLMCAGLAKQVKHQIVIF